MDFLLPSLGADMEAGTLLEWRVRPGDHVHKGDIVAVVETDKGAIDVESFQEGDVTEILIEPGARVPVGTPIATLDGGAATPADQPPATQASPPPVIRPQSEPEAAAAVKAVPAAKRLAKDLGVNIGTLTGTGEGGAITKADVERAASSAQADPATAMRRAIAAAMSRSNREIPHYYLADTIDMTRALERLATRNADKPLAARILSGVLILRSVALAAKEFPEMNGFWQDDGFRQSAEVNLGVAISLRQGGLVTPAIRGADGKSLEELMTDLRGLISRVRATAGKLRSSEVGGATLTVTNLGDLGVESVFGVIYPPQVALVGAGAVVDRPWAIDGRVEIRKVCRVTLAADHRASDGLRGARFLAAVKGRLESGLDEVFA